MFFSLWYHYWPIWKLVRYGMLKRQCPILSILLAMQNHSQLQLPKTPNGQNNVKVIWDVRYLSMCFQFLKYNRKRQRPIQGQKHISKKHATNPLLCICLIFGVIWNVRYPVPDILNISNGWFSVWYGILNIQYSIFSIFLHLRAPACAGYQQQWTPGQHIDYHRQEKRHKLY